MNALLRFPRKQFQLRHSKITKIVNNAIFKHSEELFFDFNVASKLFSQILLVIKFGFKEFWRICLAFAENASTLPLKNLQNSKKFQFQTFRRFVFDLNIASNDFLKYVRWSTLDLNNLNALPHFSRKRLQLRYWKNCKKVNNIIFELSEHSFLTSRYLENYFFNSEFT